MSTKRMTANPAKAPRYRPGKAVPEVDPSDSDASDGEEQEPSLQAPSKPLPKFTSAGGIASNLSNVSLDERRKIAAAVEAARLEEEKALRAKEEEGFVTEESDEEEDSEEGSDEETDEESESEEEAPRKVLLRPTFIKKDKRNAMGVSTVDNKPDEEKLAEEEARRQAAADEIVEEQIRKDLAAKAAGKKHWDDEESNASDVDDTDDIDPEAEHAAWKLRELKRIKRDREAIETREREIEELERRKNLSVEERQAEDDAHLARQKEEKDGKAKMSYLQKYHHKGAFFQDHARAEGLDSREIMGARFADEVQNRELLPQALQMRDMTKLGKKGATKYRDLRTEDTGRWGQFDDRRPRDAGGPFVADDRFRPDAQGRGGGGAGITGANSQPVAMGRRNPVLGAPEGPRAGRDDTRGDGYRPRDERGGRSRSPRREKRIRSRSRSRSRSPRREGGHGDRRHRKRSYSRERERERERDRHEDKRQRVDSR